jgi:hypothetical protein
LSYGRYEDKKERKNTYVANDHAVDKRRFDAQLPQKVLVQSVRVVEASRAVSVERT